MLATRKRQKRKKLRGAKSILTNDKQANTTRKRGKYKWSLIKSDTFWRPLSVQMGGGKWWKWKFAAILPAFIASVTVVLSFRIRLDWKFVTIKVVALGKGILIDVPHQITQSAAETSPDRASLLPNGYHIVYRFRPAPLCSAPARAGDSDWSIWARHRSYLTRLPAWIVNSCPRTGVRSKSRKAEPAAGRSFHSCD